MDTAEKTNWSFVIITFMVIVFLIGYGKNLGNQVYNQTDDNNAECVGYVLKNKNIIPLPVLGDENAPLLIEVYSDYQCPFASRYYIEDIRLVIKDYINTGKARLVYRELAFEGERSEWAAEAARCANDQGKFWEFHDKIFQDRYSAENTDIYEKDNLKKIAQSLGLDVCEFNQCLDSDKYVSLIKEETQNNLDQRINGTPTTFLNGVRMVNEEGESWGALPYEDLTRILNKY